MSYDEQYAQDKAKWESEHKGQDYEEHLERLEDNTQ